ncbi:MAG: ABC transporter ATP-binding protein [Betaproteobacteria bacterium]|nr:ABC transporter ATP-binding protein [Betaproteobacteria bacterium]
MNGPPKSPPVFRLLAVGKTYGEGAAAVHALREVNLEVAAGEFMVMLGPSGSGKSTLLNLMGGLDRPSCGELHFRAQRLDGASDATLTRFRREHVGFVFQFYNLIPSLTVWENVALVAELVPHPMPVDEALKQVGLLDRAHHFPSEISGGEQQRVAIARAVVKQPAVLLCDEPTGALDCETGKRVLQTLLDIHDRLNTTVVVITHNAVIAGLADRVVRLANGRIAALESPVQKVRVEDIAW